MNERIQQCWLMASREDSGDDTWDSQEQFIERFAELIVQECAKLVEESMDPYNAWITPTCIKQHFGVEK